MADSDTHVRDVMTTPVETISRRATVMEAAERMRDRDIRSLVVTGPRSIITTTDVLDAVIAGEDLDELTVADVMTKDVETVTPDIRLEEASAMMVSLGINHLPVIDSDGDYVGILSSTDVTSEFS